MCPIKYGNSQVFSEASGAISFDRMGRRMKFVGFLLLLAGWGIVLAAVVLLASALPRTGFVLAGVGVEVLGLILVVRSHLVLRGERG